METTTATQRENRPRGLDASTLCEAFQITAEDHPDRTALRTQGDEFSITWGEYADRVRQYAAGLAALGLGKGDTMAIMLTNRPEFHLVDSAAMHLGATPFSVYNTYSPEQIAHLVSDSKAAILVTEQAFLDRILKVNEECGTIEHVISVDGGEGAMTLDELAERGEEDFDFDAAWRSVEPDDILTLIYTSGTTGPPKGVQLTHGNLVSAVQSFDQIIAFPNDGRVVSYLPMAHVAERNCSQYLPMMLGFTATRSPDARQVVGYLPEVRPTWFFAVPRIFEKLKAGLEAMIAGEEDEQKKQGMEWALGVGQKKVEAEQENGEVPEELQQEYQKADEMVLSKLREKLGLNDLESANVGAAPTPREVIEFYHALGIPLAELWGMSETTGAGTCNPPDRIKIGTVGPPAPDVEIKLADDGEVLV